MGQNLVIVAIPDENDRVWKISSEKVPHLTLLFLGDVSEVSNLDSIMQFVGHAADRSLCRFYLPVDHRGELGADQADVLFFKKGRYDFKAVRDFRSLLLKDQNIRTAYDSATQFETPESVGEPGQAWIPHLTLGYPATPAKPLPDDWSTIYDVQFNKIAVWTGDSEGPDWLLKDYWDEMDENGYDMDAPVGAMSMSDLRHFGTRGMRWGVRNETISVGGKTQQVTKRQAKKADVNWAKDFHKLKTFGFDDQKFTSEYNAKWKDHDFSKEDWNKPSPSYQKYQDGYFHEMQGAYQKQIVDHYGSSPTGKMRIEKTDKNDEIKLVHNPTGVSGITRNSPGSGTSNFGHDAIMHAKGDQLIRTFKVTFDDKGLITAVKPVEDAMSQTSDLGIEFLEHHGVRGMRWGVRNDNPSSANSGGLKKVGGGLKKAGKGLVTFGKDVNFESRTTPREDGSSSRAKKKVVRESQKDFREKDLAKINAKPEHVKASKLKNRLRHPLDPGTKAYRKEVKAAYIKRLETTANSITNGSGDRQYTTRERHIDLPGQGGALPTSKYFFEVTARNKLKHAAGDEDIVLVEMIMDDDGFIVDSKLVEPDAAMAQTVDLGAMALSSLGISVRG